MPYWTCCLKLQDDKPLLIICTTCIAVRSSSHFTGNMVGIIVVLRQIFHDDNNTSLAPQPSSSLSVDQRCGQNNINNMSSISLNLPLNSWKLKNPLYFTRIKAVAPRGAYFFHIFILYYFDRGSRTFVVMKHCQIEVQEKCFLT